MKKRNMMTEEMQRSRCAVFHQVCQGRNDSPNLPFNSIFILRVKIQFHSFGLGFFFPISTDG